MAELTSDAVANSDITSKVIAKVFIMNILLKGAWACTVRFEQTYVPYGTEAVPRYELSELRITSTTIK